MSSKRCFDVVIVAATAPLWIALCGVVSLLVWLTLGRPILFRQLRPGLNGKPFTLIKFRTMRDGRDDANRPLADHMRLTRVGRWLRATSLDELPELVNVLRGEMSLVGPRPLLMDYLPLYSAEQARRHDARPGITGWAQINGRNALSWEEKFRLDVWYVENRNFWLDIRILLLTIWAVLSRRGIAQRGHATAEAFTGMAAESVTPSTDRRGN